MDQRVRSTIPRQDLDEVKGIVRRLTTRKRPERPKSRWVIRVENAEKLGRALSVIGLFECAVLAVVGVAFESLALLRTVSAMGMLITLLLIAVLMSPIAVSVPFFRTLYRTPFAPLLEALDDDMALDLPAVLELIQCDREAVEYVLAHYRHQRNAFEKRGMMLAGALDKIGFFPALVAFAMLLIPAWEHLHVWIRTFALLVPAFHFMNLLGYGLTQEMDRTIALLEYSLAARNRAEG